MSAITATFSRVVAARPGRSSSFVLVCGAVLELVGFVVETVALALFVVLILTFFVSHADRFVMAHQWSNLLGHYVDAPAVRRAPFDHGVILCLGLIVLVCAALRQAPRREVSAAVARAVAALRRTTLEHHND